MWKNEADAFDSLRPEAKPHLSSTSPGSLERVLPPAVQTVLAIKCVPSPVTSTIVNFPEQDSTCTLILQDISRACWRPSRAHLGLPQLKTVAAGIVRTPEHTPLLPDGAGCRERRKVPAPLTPWVALTLPTLEWLSPNPFQVKRQICIWLKAAVVWPFIFT